MQMAHGPPAQWGSLWVGVKHTITEYLYTKPHVQAKACVKLQYIVAIAVATAMDKSNSHFKIFSFIRLMKLFCPWASPPQLLYLQDHHLQQ